MPLIAICGGLGAGKTLKLTERGIYYRSMGYNLYTNYDLKNVSHTFLEHPMEILDIETKRNIILGDEFYTWFDCYETNVQVKKAMRNIINVSRKKDLIIIGTSQRLDQFNVKFRNIMDCIYYPTYLKDYDIMISTIKMFPVDYGISTFQLQTISKEYIFNVSRFFKYYNTNEIIKGFLDFEGNAFKELRGKQKQTSFDDYKENYNKFISESYS